MTKFDRNYPAIATIKERYPLTKESSSKQTWHVTLDVKNTDLAYHPGDSVGILAQNDPALVDHLIEAMHAKPTDLIIHKRTGEKHTLHAFLSYHANLSRITSPFLKLIHEYDESSKELMQSLLSDKPKLRAYLSENDPLHLLRDYAHCKLPIQEVCDQFGPLLPRFYSVASSQCTQKDTLDLTIALFTWMQNDEKRYGVASHFLCHLAEIEKTPVPLYVQPAPHFHLPSVHDTPIIMIGPGTGIAPFRAFMQERAHHSATGNNWLFFGERNQKSDFFYEKEWATHKNLKLHTAFSRDQEEKVYVQHKMLENAKELYTWLQNGAHLYVCGDAKEMAKDVDKALHQILTEQGEDAKAYIKALKKEGRYKLDVY